tara:strand:+ start:456 stop:1445 length:990 start_codon:yes stop_codon:yes gene_type:complete
LDQNTAETLKFLDRLRRRLLWGSSKNDVKWLNNENGAPWVGTYLDFSQIEYISASVALILAAEYERAVEATKIPPPVINIHEWQQSVFDRFFELGFFSIVRLSRIEEGGHVVSNQDRMTLRFLSGSDASEAEAADLRLLELAEFIDPDHELPASIAVPINTALSEAMVNVRMHAYPSWHHFQFRPVNRWWLTGTADRTTRTLTISIYDQGASIPITYDRLAKPAGIEKFIRDRLDLLMTPKPYASDAVHIESAMRYGNSQSERPNRGKGLPQMQDAIERCGEGRLNVHSRGGRYAYATSTKTVLDTFKHSVGGTLIEWIIRLPQLEPQR